MVDSKAEKKENGDSKSGPVAEEDSERQEQKLKYPKVVFFIIGNEFCERFTYYGMRTILSIFLKNALDLEQSQATIIYHVFTCLCYLFPVLGAIIADSWLGKFRTIAYLSIVYAVGNIVVSAASGLSSLATARGLTYLGLLLIAVGTGGIKPCVSSFGGEQFTVPQQARQLASFFSVFYFSINAGSLISTWLTPELRETECLGSNTCYPLAFGVPAILMVVAIVIFFLGKPSYKIVNPRGNVLVEVSKCIGSAVSNKAKGKSTPKDNWLDYADSKYSDTLRNDIRVMLRVLLLFVPLPVFWALYDQQGSKWTFQANNMNGRIGSFVFKPDQMQVVNPILIMILLPFFDYVVYPFLNKFNLLKTALQKMATGGMLAAVAFIISGLLQIQLEPNMPIEPSSGLAQVRVFSTLPYNVTLNNAHTLSPYSFWARTDVPALSTTTLTLSVTGPDAKSSSHSLQLTEEQSVSFNLYLDDSKNIMVQGPYTDDLAKDAFAKIRIMYHFSGSEEHTIKLNASGGYEKYEKAVRGSGEIASRDIQNLDLAMYKLYVDDQDMHAEQFLDVGGAYNVLVGETDSKVDGAILEVIRANEINLFWQLPQYIIISVAEVMFSVPGLEFSFTEAPASVKSVMSSAWLLTDSIGNIIIILIESVKIFPNQSDEMFLFAGLMAAVMLIFIWLAIRYKPVVREAKKEREGEDTQM